MQTSMPWRPTASAVLWLMPPSTCTRPPRPADARSARASAILGASSGWKPWPPQPGSTVMTMMMSRTAAHRATACTGVAGLTASPAPCPAAWMAARRGVLLGVVLGRLDVEGDGLRRRGDEAVDVAEGLIDHEVHVERQVGDAPPGSHDIRAEGEVGHEVAVHDIEVQAVHAGPLELVDDAVEAAEVGVKDARGDEDAVRVPSGQGSHPHAQSAGLDDRAGGSSLMPGLRAQARPAPPRAAAAGARRGRARSGARGGRDAV